MRHLIKKDTFIQVYFNNYKRLFVYLFIYYGDVTCTQSFPMLPLVLGDTHDTYLVSRYQIFTIPVSWRPRYLLVSRYLGYRGTFDYTNYETYSNIFMLT
jgi:hypothetical protein